MTQRAESTDHLVQQDLGSCCGCGTKINVHTVLLLPMFSPMPGRGWGCFQCGLPEDGAVAVLCDACIEHKREPTEACQGYPATDGRIPIGELIGGFGHDTTKHPELWSHT